MNRGLTDADYYSSGLGVHYKYDSTLHGSIEIKKMVNNLCESHKYH